jgi:hypothetical protein
MGDYAREGISMKRTITYPFALISLLSIFLAFSPAAAQETYFTIDGVQCYKSGTSFVPEVTVTNPGATWETREIWVTLYEDSKNEDYLYDYIIEVQIPGGGSKTVTFPPFSNGYDYTSLYYYISVEMTGETEWLFFDDDVEGTWYW